MNRSPVVVPPDFSETVFPITKLRFLGVAAAGAFGTGFCLDPDCRFIATNYHVAMLADLHKIKGEKVIHRYLATGPDDEGATINHGTAIGAMKFNLSHDLAIFELRHPIPHCHGAAFSLNELQVGQQVEIYAFPKVGINPIRSLHLSHGTFRGETTSGLLAFDYITSPGNEIRPGASGGVVVDTKSQQIVGVLNAIAMDGEPIALAVPVQSLADFVRNVEPYLAQRIFVFNEGISPVSVDIYPKFVPQPTNALERRSEESSEVAMLRGNAQLLADSMRNFIAVQTFAWGSENKPPSAEAEYEIRVLDGYQRFRKYPAGTKEFQDVPLPPLDTAMVPGGEWSELPEMVGTKLGLKIHQAADAFVNGKNVKVFQYWADQEDGVCRWKSILDFGLFAFNKIATVSCYGEVWTDPDLHILRISEHYNLSSSWKNYQAVVTYGWLQRPKEPAQLIPLTISTQATYNKKVHWCRGRFTDYRMFSSKVKIAADSGLP